VSVSPQKFAPAGEHKNCKVCGVAKPLADFYNCHAKDEQPRWEPQCKICKRQRRTSKANPVNQPKRLIEPAVPTSSIPKSFIEPRKNSANASLTVPDFSLWENKYGRSLGEVERIEIQHNLTAFFKILIAESGRLPGYSDEHAKNQ
jgi:hypothetical protein